MSAACRLKLDVPIMIAIGQAKENDFENNIRTVWMSRS